MVPGYEMSMENVLDYHTKKQLGLVYDKFISYPGVVEKMGKIGLSINPKVSELENHYCIINILREEFRSKYEFAVDKLECITNKIQEYRTYYEEKLTHRVYGVVRTDLAVTDQDMKWPPSYVTYHCKKEGFDATLSSLHIVMLYQLVFAERFAVSRLEIFLKELAKQTRPIIISNNA